MLSPDDATLVARDPALPGLGLVLDDAALGEWLGGVVRRTYIRYKPGTAAVVGLQLDGRRCFALAQASAGVGKLRKTVEMAPPGGVLAVDIERQVLAGLPAADRDLPGAALLASGRARLLRRTLPGRDVSGELTLLAYKPQRRLVALLSAPTGDKVVLRIHRPAVAAQLAHAPVPAGGPPTPSLLGRHARAGLLAMSWLPGDDLAGLLECGAAGSPELQSAGAALARLHACPTGPLPARTADNDVREMVQAATAVGALVPSLNSRATALANRLVAELSTGREPDVTVHGDFSADQVVMGEDGSVAFVDLDAAATGEAGLDLGSAVAALLTSEVLGAGPADPAACADDLVAGYAEHAPVPQRFETQVAAALLRRAVEPFRLGAPDWVGRVDALLTLAEQRLPVRVGR